MTNKASSFGFRLVQLFVLLSSSEHSYTLTRLSQIFSCSRQSILRMIEQLALLPGNNLQTYKIGKERHYKITSKVKISDFSFDIEVLRNLIMCKDIVRHILPEPVHEEIGRALEKLAGDNVRANESQTEAFWKGRIDYTPYQKIIRVLLKAVDDNKICNVRYQSKINHPPKQFFVMPIRLLSFREALYARGIKCDSEGVLINDKPMTLAVHRITNIKLTKKRIETPEDDPKAHHFGFWFNEPFEVRIRFAPEAATYVSERCWSEGQRVTPLPDGGVELCLTSTSRPEVISWVLGFGDTAELIEPADLREEIADTLTKSLTVYRR